MTVNENILDRTISHSIYFERYKAGEVKKIINLLDKSVFSDLLSRVRNDLDKLPEGTALLTPVARKRLSKMAVTYGKILKEGYKQIGGDIQNSLAETAIEEGEWSLKTLDNAVPFEYDFIEPSVSRLEALANTTPIRGKYLKDYVKELPVETATALNNAITVGYIEGETTQQIVKRVKDSLEISRNHLATLVRTATTEVSAAAKETVAKRNEDVVKGMRYDATLDSRTTLICINLDGEVFPVDEGPRPPQHFNCRSTMSYVLEDWKEFGIDDPPAGTRASMNGQVPRETTYPEWLKKQPKSVQNKVLGKTRADLWRSGKVKLDKFEKGGKTLSLEQLRKQEGLSEKTIDAARSGKN